MSAKIIRRIELEDGIHLEYYMCTICTIFCFFIVKRIWLIINKSKVNTWVCAVELQQASKTNSTTKAASNVNTSLNGGDLVIVDYNQTSTKRHFDSIWSTTQNGSLFRRFWKEAYINFTNSNSVQLIKF